MRMRKTTSAPTRSSVRQRKKRQEEDEGTNITDYESELVIESQTESCDETDLGLRLKDSNKVLPSHVKDAAVDQETEAVPSLDTVVEEELEVESDTKEIESDVESVVIDSPKVTESDVQIIENDDKIEKMESDLEGDTDSDEEAPEGISLQESKRKAHENIMHLLEAQKAVKDHKKKILQDRQVKNREQQKQKKSLIPERIDENVLALSGKNDRDNVDEIVNSIMTDIDTPRLSIHTVEAKNNKIVFSDNDDDNDDDDFGSSFDEGFSERDFVKSKKQNLPITAKYLSSVNKTKSIGLDARKFLQQHFFGDRLKRENKQKSAYKKHRIGKRSKI